MANKVRKNIRRNSTKLSGQAFFEVREYYLIGSLVKLVVVRL